MKAHNIKYIVALLLILLPLAASAQQQQPEATDSISVFELMDAVEKSTSCRIYTTITEPFLVKRIETKEPTAEHLRQVLAATLYEVTVYESRIFVLPEAFLATSLPPVLRGEKPGAGDEQLSSYIPVVNSSSENKVYKIGDKHKSAAGDMVTLTGKVMDFKTGQNLSGINIVHREPWVATTTNPGASFPLSCLWDIMLSKSAG